MTTSSNLRISPRFSRNQIVHFMGSVGRIKSYQANSNTWTYAVEMEVEPEPNFERVGSETIILLDEVDIKLLTQYTGIAQSQKD